jgi:hypothetical protein
MLGGKSGLINEAVNHHTNEQLTEAIKYMGTKEYQQSRDTSDVIPTHRRQRAKLDRPEDAHLPVFTTQRGSAAAAAAADGDAPDDLDDGDDDDDGELAALRAIRMGSIKKQTERLAEWQSKGHGMYTEIVQDAFFNTVVREKGGSDMVVVHFYHRDFQRCQIIDKHLALLAPQMLPIRFCKIDAQKCPFLVERLRVNVLPCCVMFLNDVAVDRIVGFDGLQMTDKCDDVEEESVKHRVEVGLKLVEE